MWPELIHALYVLLVITAFGAAISLAIDYLAGPKKPSP